ncbi:ATPase synthesis protein 25 mitochondrial [Toensbergia leucococca]|nr:ATPase synthesis protein 25 mitochondrial [Toensbergia leucococca]
MRPALTKLSYKQPLPNRGFTSLPRWRDDLSSLQEVVPATLDHVQEEDPIDSAGRDQDPSDREDAVDRNSVSAAISNVPWYLQVEDQKQSPSPLSERQWLPELPNDSPPLLRPMLEHISIDLGLDDLDIIDLRKLDPPPALGTNLIMILGTARSERHLHVSADRFCRWLRRVHKLSPYADGLLGRNELKLLMRRKSRRAKLLGSVGSSETGSPDEGLRTGWICVNVGMIEDTASPVEETAQPDGFVGFGDGINGAKVVIQMLTAEKREELDLEALWGRMLARQEKSKGQDTQEMHLYLEEEEVGQSYPVSEGLKPNKSFSSHNKLPTSNGMHLRGFHTSARCCAIDIEGKGELEYKGPDFSSRGMGVPFSSNASVVPLESHLNDLKACPREIAVEMLGLGVFDSDSTFFLRSFFQHFPLFPSSEHWGLRFDMISYGILLNHPKYTKKDLMSLLHEMQASAIDIPEPIFLGVFKSVLTHTSRPEDQSRALLTVEDFRMALEVLDDMCLRGYEVMTGEILSTLQNALNIIQCENHASFADKFQSDAQLRLLQLLQLANKKEGKITTTESHLAVLRIHADEGNWSDFWRYWRGIARQMQPKSKELYAAMFGWVAATGHQANCVNVIRMWQPEMQREEPPVLLSEVAEALMECIRVIVPNIASEVERPVVSNSEWVVLWMKCEESRNIA